MRAWCTRNRPVGVCPLKARRLGVPGVVMVRGTFEARFEGNPGNCAMKAMSAASGMSLDRYVRAICLSEGPGARLSYRQAYNTTAVSNPTMEGGTQHSPFPSVFNMAPSN